MAPLVRKRRYFFNTLEAMRYTSITTTIVAALALYSFWFAYLLVHVSSNLKPEVQTYRYGGPLKFGPLKDWGWWFVGVGVLELCRLAIHSSRRGISFGLHVLSMSVLMAWAISYMTGTKGPDTSQPAYAFIALVAFVLPFLVDMLERRRNERNPAPRPPDFDGDDRLNAGGQADAE